MANRIWKAAWLLLAVAHAIFALRIIGGEAGHSLLQLSVLFRLGALALTTAYCTIEAFGYGPISWFLGQRDWRALTVAGLIVVMLHGAVPGRYLNGDTPLHLPHEAVTALAIIPITVPGTLGALALWMQRRSPRTELAHAQTTQSGRPGFRYMDGETAYRARRLELRRLKSGYLATLPPPGR